MSLAQRHPAAAPSVAPTPPAHAADLPQPDHHARRDARAALDRTLPRHGAVEILPQAPGWSTLSPWAPQPAPSHWLALQLELSKRWPMPSLLEVRQDTDLRVALPRLFRSPTAWETLARAPLQSRLWLALYGRGTGAGFKRGSSGAPWGTRDCRPASCALGGAAV